MLKKLGLPQPQPVTIRKATPIHDALAVALISSPLHPTPATR
jgi:hypothetical protein